MNKKLLFMAACCCGCQALNAANLYVPVKASRASDYNIFSLNVPYGGIIDFSNLTINGWVIFSGPNPNIYARYNDPYWNKAYCELDIWRPLDFSLQDGSQLTYSLGEILGLPKQNPDAFKTLVSQLHDDTVKQIMAICHWLRKSAKKSIEYSRYFASSANIEIIPLVVPSLDHIVELSMHPDRQAREASSTFYIRDFAWDFYQKWAYYSDDFSFFLDEFARRAPTVGQNDRPDLVNDIMQHFSVNQARRNVESMIEEMEWNVQNGRNLEYSQQWLDMSNIARDKLNQIDAGQPGYKIIVVTCNHGNKAAQSDYSAYVRHFAVSEHVFPMTIQIASQRREVTTPTYPIDSKAFGDSAKDCFVVIAQDNPEPTNNNQPHNDNQ